MSAGAAEDCRPGARGRRLRAEVSGGGRSGRPEQSAGAAGRGGRPDGQRAARRYNQPLSAAIRTASARLRAAVFWMAVER